jgi:hypothetical protein
VGVLDLDAQADALVQAEALGVLLEPAADRVAARVVRSARRHRVLLELRARLAGDQVERLVRGGVAVLERPDAADARAFLERHGVDAGGRECAECRQARRAGADNSDTRVFRHLGAIFSDCAPFVRHAVIAWASAMRGRAM